MQLVDRLLAKNRPAGEGSPEDAVAKLRTTTYDGIVIEPLYTRDDVAALTPAGYPGFSPFTRGRTATGTRTGGWDIRALISVRPGTPQATDELQRGATSILLRLADDEMLDRELLDSVLNGVFFDLAPITIDAGRQWATVARLLTDAWASSKVDPAVVRGSLGADPLGLYAAVGGGGATADFDLDAQLADVASWATTVRSSYPNVQVLTVDGARYHNAGSSDSEELGLLLAAATTYLRMLVGDGVPVAEAFGLIELRIAATADQFATIAKVRACRRLWGRVAEAAGVASAAKASPLHAITSTAMMTRYDPWVNLLRTTVACFSAGVGGADSITVLPYDDLIDADGSELGHRLARNTQSVLALESNLTKVIDPAGGSWYVEARSEELAAAAWRQFQSFEAAGGFRAAVDSGLVTSSIDASWKQRLHNLASRRDPITGVSEFPNIAEQFPTVEAPAGDPSDGHGLAVHRYAEIYESLRQRVDRHAAATGSRPSVFLASVGAPAATTARVTFAKNLFEIAGITTITASSSGAGRIEPEAIAAEFAASGSTVACICSTDAVYAEHSVAVATALAAAGAASIYLAGRPKDLMQSLYDAGVDHFIYVGCDVAVTLANLLTTLEVS